MARPSYPSDDVEKLLLRFPEGMRDQIKRAAEVSGRSMNAEITQRLKRSFSDDALLRLDLPSDVWNALMADAGIHGVQMEERAVQVLKNAYDPEVAYTLALDKIRDLYVENAESSELIQELKQKQDYDFLLYYNKVVQLQQLALLVIGSDSQNAQHARDAAIELNKLAQAELVTIRNRHEDAIFLQRLQKERQMRSAENEAQEESDDVDLDAPINLKISQPKPD